MSDFLDHPKTVRPGEEIARESLENYLAEHISDLQTPIEIHQFPSGFSNLTYCIQSGKNQWVLRRPPVGSKVKTAHDMAREFFILSQLHSHYPVPKPLLHCDDSSVIGAPFYIMERISGVILRKDLPKELSLTTTDAKNISENFIDHLVQLHSIDYCNIGLEDWGKPEGYVERQVSGWAKRYQKSKTHEIAEISEIIQWLQNNIPETQKYTIIHNDYKYDNIVLNPQKMADIVGVLDWEMATIGDPLMDLGMALGYWINHNDPKPMQQLCIVPTNIPGMLTRQQLAEYYAEKSALDISEILFYYCFALFKITVIAQQIYYRFHQGLTKDPRFAALVHYIQGFVQIAMQAITTKKL